MRVLNILAQKYHNYKVVKQRNFMDEHVSIPIFAVESKIAKNIREDLYDTRLTLARYAAAQKVHINILPEDEFSSSNIIVNIANKKGHVASMKIDTSKQDYLYENILTSKKYSKEDGKDVYERYCYHSHLEGFVRHLYRVVASLTKTLTK